MLHRFSFATRNQLSVSARQIIHVVLLLSLLLGYAPLPVSAAPPEPLEPVIEEPAGNNAASADSETGVPEYVEDPLVEDEPPVPLTYEEIEAAGSAQEWPVELPTPEAEEVEWRDAEQLPAPAGLPPAVYLPLVKGEGAEEGPAIVELGEDLPDSAFVPSWDEPLLEVPELAADAFAEEEIDEQEEPQNTQVESAVEVYLTDSMLGLTLAYNPLRWVPTLLADNGIASPDGVSTRTIGLASVNEDGWFIVSAYRNSAGLTLQQWIDQYDYVRTGTLPVYSERMIANLPTVVLRESPEVYTGAPPNWRAVVAVDQHLFMFEYAVLQPDEQLFEQMLDTVRFEKPTQQYIRSTLNMDVSNAVQELSALNESMTGSTTNVASCCGVTDPEYNPFPCPTNGTGNCTWWVRYRRTGDNKANLAACTGNANTWDECAASNYPDLLSDSPAQGAAAVWMGSSENHVQFVEWLNGNGSIHVSEMNWNTTCQRDFDQNRTWTIKYIQMPGSGSCSAPQQNSPGDGETLSSRTVNFSWQTVNCGQGFTFRVKDTSDMDSGGTTIIDTGEGGTSRTETLGAEWDNRDLYWGVRAANTTNAPWSVRRFRISPGGGNNCSQPNPNSDQAVLFAETGYSGTCAVLGVGEYSNPGNFGSVGNDNVSSIRVGSNARLILCRDDNYQGGCDTFEGDDDDLGNNGIGNNNASSAKVEQRTSGGSCDSPGADQAAIFSDADFRGGCNLLGIGDYSSPASFSNVGNDGASSLRVGSNVRVILYENEGFGGRSETFESDRSNLAGTGIGDSVVSSIKVQRRLPSPAIPSLASPANGAIFEEGQAVELSWNGAANAIDYYGEISGGPNLLTFGWQGNTSYSAGALAAGYQYAWRVKAGNGQAGSDWSETRTFTVRPGAPRNLSAVSPGCGKANVAWSDGSGSEQGYRIYRNGSLVGEVGANVTTFAQSSVPAGAYTYNVYAYRGSISSVSSNSAQVTVGACAPVAKLTVTTTPANQVHTGAGPVATRFTFQETAGTAVSIRSYTYRWYSANGSVALSGAVAPITLNLNVPGGGSATWSAGVQLPGWVVQKAADRGESVVRLHFTFNGVDSAGRTVSAATYATLQLSACGDTAEPNNATANAKTISYGQTLTGVICPAGDLDLYKFSGAAGDRLRIAARQRAGSGTLNPMLELLASDGRTVVAANNDRAIDQLQTDSRIAVVLPSTGLYYLRITDAARRGGVAQSYDLLLHQDTALPSVAIRPLAGGSWVHATQQLIRVNAGDRGSEVDHVQFFVLLPDGQGWKFLGSDATAADGWFFRWNTAQIAPHQGSAIYVYAIDGADNSRGVGLYNLGLERTAPTVKATAGPVYGDAPFRDFSVSWRNGYDSGSGIASYDVQVRKGATGAWTNWLTATTLTAARYVGIVGYSYYFRARAHDRTGATSAFAGGNGDAAFTVRACPANADNYETDNSATAARSVRSDGSRYWHNFHYEGDNDWVKFYARAATTYTLRTYMEGKHADTVLTLYSTDGKTVLATNDDIAAAGGPSQIAWKASATGVYFARITHHDPYGHGCTTAYHIGVTATPATSSLPAAAGGNMADNMVDSELAPPGDFAPPQENARDGTE